MITRVVTSMMAASLLLTGSVEAGVLDGLKGIFNSSYSQRPTMIRVLVLHDAPGVVLDVRSKYRLYDPLNGEMLSHRHMGKKQYFQPMAEGLKWGEEFPGLHQLRIVSDDPNAAIFVDGIPYRGSLYLYDIGGAISIVNELPVEEYLASILTPAFPEPINHEVLAAVAIAARTQAYYALEAPKNKYWNVDAKKVGYEGLPQQGYTNELIRALSLTNNMILSKNGNYDGRVVPFAARWGSTTGGKPLNEDAVFSHITLHEANDMANKGDNAAKILKKAFPGASIELINQ